jgi:hypothetical protein
MSFASESHDSNREFDSTRDWSLSDDLDEVISIYDEHFVTVTAGNGEPNKPTEILLGGQTEGDEIDSLVDISLTLLYMNGQCTATISLEAPRYVITDNACR